MLCSLALGSATDSLTTKTPGKAALWALIPGAGQAYNGKYLKAVLIFGIEVAAVWRFDENRQSYKTYDENYALPKYRYLEKRNKYAWWIFFTYVYGFLDAVVDAHLAPFDEVMQEDLEFPESKPQPTEDTP